MPTEAIVRFLDFEGVLNHDRWLREHGEFSFDPDLDQLVQTDYQIGLTEGDAARAVFCSSSPAVKAARMS